MSMYAYVCCKDDIYRGSRGSTAVRPAPSHQLYIFALSLQVVRCASSQHRASPARALPPAVASSLPQPHCITIHIFCIRKTGMRSAGDKVSISNV